MYSVAKRIEFCYGHRLLDYNGVCAHPHGHNAVAELEIRSSTLDGRNMVMDFTDIKRAIKTWVDKELDHKMILRQDDPLVPVLQGMREPVFTLDGNPTAERIARLIFDVARDQGLPVARVTVWETPTSWATYSGDASQPAGDATRRQ
jgi:6-pyruvoyltetrahydropterin/6-carboxytetrahydropterin synthase